MGNNMVASFARSVMPAVLLAALPGCTDNAGMAASGNPGTWPAYLKLHGSGELRERGEKLSAMMGKCGLCPRDCGAARLKGKRGFCGASSRLAVSSHHLHFGEEPPLVGSGGSGTIFFSNCPLRCVFCINWEISHGGVGAETDVAGLAGMMLDLQKAGAHNINLVTPTHYLPHILLALDEAAGRGLRLPVVYNTSGWEKKEILEYLDGVVDIYLPDFKYWSGEMSARYSAGAAAYPELAKAALLEMHRQVGVARPGPGGVMRRGLMIRHLVMPNGVSGSKEVLSWIAENLPRDTYVNIMSQYRPAYRAAEYPAIARPVSRREYDEAVSWARGAGLTNLEIQGLVRPF